MSLRTFYNEFIEALGRQPNMQIDVKVHPQLDGGAILEATVTDSQGRISKQELHVSMSDSTVVFWLRRGAPHLAMTGCCLANK